MKEKENEIPEIINSENKINIEEVIQDLNNVFTYARAHVASVRPHDESVMIGLINFKKMLIEIINK